MSATKKEYQALVKTLNQYSDAYYIDDNPMVSDPAFDKLMNQLKDIEAEHPSWISKQSPTQKVGGRPSEKLPSIAHKTPLLSLQDIFSKDELDQRLDDLYAPSYTVEDKVDGLSLALVYENGVLTKGITRGNGRIGEDVSLNAKVITNVPKTLQPLKEFEHSLLIVRHEAYLSLRDFERLNQQRASENKELFKNPRNAAAGTLRTLDPEITKQRNLKAVAFQILYHENIQSLEDTASQSEQLQWLDQHDFPIVHYTCCQTKEEIFQAIDNIDENRKNKDYAIDGAVVKINDLLLHDIKGNTDKYPRWAVAYKYQPEQAKTKIVDILTQTGRTGVITPVAVFEPVELAGTTVTKATLHNMNYINTNLGGISIGDTILVHKSGEIIPEVLQVLNHDAKNAFTITECPVCHAPVYTNDSENGQGTQTYCSNLNCPAILEGQLIHWCSKPIMNIQGMGPKAVQLLLKHDLVHAVYELYDLSQEILTRFFGDVKGANLYAEIQKSKTQNINKLIAGLGIPGVGNHIGQLLAKTYPDMDSILEAARNHELRNLEGIGDITETILHDYASQPKQQAYIQAFQQRGCNWKSLSYQTMQTGGLDGCTFVITGTLPNLSRDEAKEWILQHGGKVSSSLSKKTTYLLTGENAGSKLAKARELEVPVLTWEQLQEKIKD